MNEFNSFAAADAIARADGMDEGERDALMFALMDEDDETDEDGDGD